MQSAPRGAFCVATQDNAFPQDFNGLQPFPFPPCDAYATRFMQNVLSVVPRSEAPSLNVLPLVSVFHTASTAAMLRLNQSGFLMASKTTLNAKNLETLGAARLADLLIEISTGSAVAKRRLRLELAGAQSPKEAGREVAKRLTSIARARSFVNWQNRKPLVTDLQSQLRAIKEQIGPADPAEALALAWRFMQVATPLFERCDDSSGIVIGVFHDACALLGEIALTARTPPERLAEAAVEALRDNGYGQYDGLIAILTPALGKEGLSHLKQRIEALAATPVPIPPKGDWEAVGYGSGGATYAHQMEERARQSMVAMALKDIADAMSDVDAFIAQYDPKTRKVLGIAAKIAVRLLAAGRAVDALASSNALIRKTVGCPGSGLIRALTCWTPLIARTRRRAFAGDVLRAHFWLNICAIF